MPKTISKNVWDHLACSHCQNNLEANETGAICPECGVQFPYSGQGSLDLHLRRPKTYRDTVDVGASLVPEDDVLFEPLEANPEPEVDYSNIPVPRHLTREILSYFPRACSPKSLMLDLGCGKGIHREVAEMAGYEWVGLDYEASDAPILGDGQALPFQDNSFDFILCVTVIQYVRFPFIMIREAQRVLKPNGSLIGTVAFLEPSHGSSYYHYSHLGIYNLLKHGGFNVLKLAPSKEWTVLKALASMGMFYRMPRRLAQSLVFPLELLHRLWWWGGELVTRRPLENTRVRHFTGSFTFIASKPV